MKRATNTKSILKAIGCPKLELVRCVGNAYWYFCYDDENNIWETHSVYTPRLKDMTDVQWIEIGKDFVSRIEMKKGD